MPLLSHMAGRDGVQHFPRLEEEDQPDKIKEAGTLMPRPGKTSGLSFQRLYIVAVMQVLAHVTGGDRVQHFRRLEEDQPGPMLKVPRFRGSLSCVLFLVFDSVPC